MENLLILSQCMPKPSSPKPSPEKLPTLALACIKASTFPMLASVDGDQPRLRPISPVRTEGFTVYMASLRSYHKTAEIAANPKGELCYMDAEHTRGESLALSKKLLIRS